MKVVASSSSISGNNEIRHRHGRDGSHDATNDDSEIDQVVDHLVQNPEVEYENESHIKVAPTGIVGATRVSTSSSSLSLLSLLSKNNLSITPRGDRKWVEAVQNVLWIISATFIIYYGDHHSNLLSILWSDQRIKRTSLNFALLGIVFSVGLHLYAQRWLRRQQKPHENIQLISKVEHLFFTLTISSFSLFSFALWPIWNFLSLPLLFTLFMAFVVISTNWLSEPLGVHEIIHRID